MSGLLPSRSWACISLTKMLTPRAQTITRRPIELHSPPGHTLSKTHPAHTDNLKRERPRHQRMVKPARICITVRKANRDAQDLRHA